MRTVGVELDTTDQDVQSCICAFLSRSISSGRMKYVNMVEPTAVSSHIFDVGANKGMFTRKALERFPNCQYHLFEPVENLTRRVIREDPRVTMNYVGVSNKKADGVDFYLHEGYTASSFKKATEAFRNLSPGEGELGTIKSETIRIDDYCSENDIAEIFILKIDTEGMGLEALEGAGSMLGKTQWVGIEFHTEPFYEGDEEGAITSILTERGFRRTVDVYSHYSSDDKLLNIDTLWENKRFTVVKNDFYHLDEENKIFRVLEPLD